MLRLGIDNHILVLVPILVVFKRQQLTRLAFKSGGDVEMFLYRNDRVIGRVFGRLTVFGLFVSANIDRLAPSIEREQRDRHSFLTEPGRNRLRQDRCRDENKDRSGRKKKPEHIRETPSN